MIMLVQDTVSIVRPQKWMNPPTLTNVRTTQPRTYNKYRLINYEILDIDLPASLLPS